MNSDDLESILRTAPQPPAPAGLADRLRRAVPSTVHPWPRARHRTVGEFLRRWWPTLLVGGGLLACASTWIWQQSVLRRLEFTHNEGRQRQTMSTARDASPGSAGSESRHDNDDALQRAEIIALRSEWTRLQKDAARVLHLEETNRELEAALALRLGVEPRDLQRLDVIRSRAESIRCVNNLKNVGVSLRVWAKEHDGRYPEHVTNLTTQASPAKTWICPSAHPEDGTSGSYEFLHPGGDDSEPTRVVMRCPIHGNVLLSDTSVQMVPPPAGLQAPGALVQRNGVLYYE